MPGFPRHTRSLSASRRKAGSRYPRAASARPRHHRRTELIDSTSPVLGLRLCFGTSMSHCFPPAPFTNSHPLTLQASRPCRPLPRTPLSKPCKSPSPQLSRAESPAEPRLVAVWPRSPTSFSAPPWRLRPVALSSEPRCWFSPFAVPCASDSLSEICHP
jgi:hypothetical protein